jgi:hypothetical protein
VPVSANKSRPEGARVSDAETAAKECGDIETELAELHAAFEQYFLGFERIPPTQRHQTLKKRLGALRATFINSTAVKYRIANLQQRFSTLERLWERTLLEIEAGTYKRDLFRAKRHATERLQKKPPPAARDELDDLHIDEDLDLSDLDTPEASPRAHAEPLGPVPSAAPPKPAPVVPSVVPLVPPIPPGTTKAPALKVALPPPPNTQARPAPPRSSAVNGVMLERKSEGGADHGLSEQKIKAIYDAYVMAKRRCGEDTSKLSLDTVASTLRSQVPALMKQHNAKTVEFKVVIKDGRAVLRALPKE